MATVAFCDITTSVSPILRHHNLHARLHIGWAGNELSRRKRTGYPTLRKALAVQIEAVAINH
ncbi:MAG: hypothetical protein AAGM36_20085, partial [Cyanobacteria bacterium J06597_1]